MIFVDFREEKSGILEILDRMNIKYKKLNLEIGDYIVVGEQGVNVCVERKSAPDYIGSLTSGHLNNQLVQMSTNYPFSILLVEGSISGAIINSNTRRQAVFSSLVGSCIKRSPTGESGVISMIPTDTIYDTALVLKYLQQKLTSVDGLTRTLKINPVHFTESEIVLSMLMTVPGIGKSLAESILKEFHTLQNVSNATIRELMKIQKIGKKKSKNVFEFFRYYYKS